MPKTHSQNMNPSKMTSRELKSSLSLASVFALRMFGLFIILPVFAVYAQHLEGGNDEFAVGLTLGIYGLTQGILQIPFGVASDKLGRRPVIIFGLIIFAIGSFIAASGDNLITVCIGRALQGAGAISAAVTAAISDQVREQVITKAMAFVGASIGLTFAVSMVASAPLTRMFGVQGLFVITGISAILAIAIVIKFVPKNTRVITTPQNQSKNSALKVFLDPQLLRLNIGIFMLHAALTAIFVVVPERLVSMGMPVLDHWHLYLPAVLIGFAVMMKPISWAEKNAKVARLQLILIAILSIVFVLFAFLMHSIWEIAFLLALFFACFNILEATLPSMISRCAPKEDKGLALGIYNTTQNLGLFAGGALGGLIDQHFSAEIVFLSASFAMLIWFASAIGLKEPMRHHHASGDALNV